MHVKRKFERCIEVPGQTVYLINEERMAPFTNSLIFIGELHDERISLTAQKWASWIKS